MDFAVPEELDEVRASFLAFIEREVRPVEERFRAELQEDRWTDEMRDAARALRKKSAEIGYYGAHLPEEVGGWGLSTLGYTLLVEAGSATGLRFITAAVGTPNPETTNSMPLEASPARATRDGDHCVLNGTKHFITNGAYADFAIVFAVTDAEKKAQGGITAFIVDKGTPGFSVGQQQRTMGGDTSQVELVFDDCRVPATNIVGDEGFGF